MVNKENRASSETQRSGFGGKRRSSEMNEFSPIWGGSEGYGDSDDVKQSAMGLSRDKITVRVYKGYIGKGHKEPDPLRAG